MSLAFFSLISTEIEAASANKHFEPNLTGARMVLTSLHSPCRIMGSSQSTDMAGQPPRSPSLGHYEPEPH